MNETENLIGIETGRFMHEIFGCVDSGEVVLEDGVAAFILSREFKRPEFKENINLALFHLNDLGFSEPPLFEAIFKKVKKEMPDLDYCPMETAMALAEDISEGKIKGNEERTYYVISPKSPKSPRQEEDTIPDFLGVKVSEGKIKVFGWSIKKPIPLNSVLVFSQKPKDEGVQ